MSRYHGRRRLIRYAPAHVLYARAAQLRIRAEEVARDRRSRRALNIGMSVAEIVEAIADDQVEHRRAA